MSILTNKAYKDYNYLSRYQSFPYYYNTVDGKYVQGLTNYLSDKTPYTIHVVKQGDSFDSLALMYYNNPTLYWVICSFNHITNPYIALEIDQRIKIPTISAIEYDNLRGN